MTINKEDMEFTEKEILYLKWATTIAAREGIFDYLNNTNKEFKNTYGLTMKETHELAESIFKKVQQDQLTTV